MSSAEDNVLSGPDAQELRLAEIVASFDELLKTGAPSNGQVKTPETFSREALADVERVQHCLKILEEIWPRRTAATMHVRRGTEALPGGAAHAWPTNLGRFQIRRELGRGGFGVVYQAFDPQLGREVALKVPHARVLLDAELKARFQHEARAAAVLDHPNVVQVYETGDADGAAYLALAYCPGITLAEWLRRRAEPVPFVDAARLIATLADAVQHAHERGIVHRDLKPSNILLQARNQESGVRGRESGNRSQMPDTEPLSPDSCLLTPDAWLPKITDFGLAKQVDARASFTLSGTILGTPCYMAPEQAGANPSQAGPAADVYSLGAILYELLTAQPPFHGDTPLETLNQVRFEEPVAPARLRRSIPADLATICMCCLEKDPARRYRSAQLLADDLNCYLDHRPIRARPSGPLGRLRKWASRRPAAAALVAVSLAALALLVAAGIVSDLHIRRQRDETAEANRLLAAANEDVIRERDHADQALRREERISYSRNIALAFHHWQANHIAHVQRILGECPPKLQHWEWRYLQRLCRLDLATQQIHGGSPHSMALTEDGAHVITTSFDDAVRTWKFPSLAPVQTHALAPLKDLVVSPTAASVAGRFEKTALRILDLTTNAETAVLAGNFPSRVSKPAFSRDGRLLAAVAATDDRERGGKAFALQVWDLSTGTLLHVLPEMTTGPRCLEFSHNGKSLAATSLDGAGRVWDVSTGKMRFELPKESAVGGLAFSHEDRWLLSAAADSDVHLFDAASGKRRTVFRGGPGIPVGLAVSSDGNRLAAGDTDGLVRVWDMNTAKTTLELRGHLGAVGRVAFSRDNRHILSADAKGLLKIWDALGQRERQFIAAKLPWTAALHFGPDGQIVLSSLTDGVKFIDARRGAATAWWKSANLAVAASADGKQLAAVGGKGRLEVHLRDGGGGEVALLGRHDKAIYGLGISHDQRWLASAGGDRIVKVWDVAARKLLFNLQGHGKIVRVVAFHPLGGCLASAGDEHAIRFWNVETGQAERVLIGDFGGVQSLAFTPDGKTLFSGHTERVVKVWDVAAGTEKLTLRGHTQPVYGLAVSPDGKRLASASGDQTVRLWDVDTGNELLTLSGHNEPIVAVAFSADGKRLAASGREGTVVIWDAP